MGVVGFASAGVASAETVGQAIIAAAQSIQSQAYPQESFSGAAYIYCFNGGTTSLATPGNADLDSDGDYSNCNDIGRVGFDCRGLALYAVYQGTNHAVTLPTASAQAQYSDASSYDGSSISLSSVQPGDLVFFGSSSSDVEHVGIVVSGTGSSANIISAISENYGITTKTVQWFQAEYSWVGAISIPGVGNTGGSDAGGGSGTGGGSSSVTNGEFVQIAGTIPIYEIVGGAPLYVSSWTPFGGQQSYNTISQSIFDSLNQVPSNGTFIRTAGNGAIFEVAGGAAMLVSDCDNIPGGCGTPVNVDPWDIANAGNSLSRLNAVPLDGTFIRTAGNGAIFEIAGGAAMLVSNCDNIPGGCGTPIDIDQWDIANEGNYLSGLNGLFTIEGVVGV